MARGLRLRRGYAVPVIVNHPDELSFAKVCVLERQLRAAGLTTRLVFNAGGAEGEAAHLAEALAHRPAAVALFSAAAEGQAPHLEELHRSGRPYVLIDRAPLAGLDTVHIDRTEGVARAVGHLLEGGHRAVYYLGPSGGGRTEGFERAYASRELPLPEGWALTGYKATFEDGRRAAEDLLRLHPEATAAFTYSDLYAWGALRGFIESGADVPGRVSVIGFDDRSPSQYVSPPLSTVAHPHEAVGKLAAEVILGKLDGKIRPGEGSRTAVPSFVERQSTRALG
jgi:DNA-binding LacI/PurR family transcriptional regulator